MKNIYELLNHIDPDHFEDEETDSRLTEDEKRQILNYISKKDVSYREKRRSWSGFKKTAVAVCLIIGIGMCGITVGAAVNYINGDTKYDYHETVNAGGRIGEESSQTKAEGQSLEGVDIKVTEVSRVDKEIKFQCQFTFDGDISEMQKNMAVWYQEEGRNAYGNQFFEDTKIYVNDRLITRDTKDIAIFGESVSFEGQTMNITLNVYFDNGIEENPEIRIRFEDLNMDDRIIEGVWEYAYQAEDRDYEEELVIEELAEELVATNEYAGDGEELTIQGYAVTPNGLRLFGTRSSWRNEADMVAAGDIDRCISFRVLVWDDLGNYYLMYSRGKTLISEEEGDGYWSMKKTCEYTLYDDAFAAAQQSKADTAGTVYQSSWNPDATTLTFAIQKVVSKWDENGHFQGDDCEVVTESVTVVLK